MDEQPLGDAPRTEGRREVTRRRRLAVPRRWPLLLAAALLGAVAGAGGLVVWSRWGAVDPLDLPALGVTPSEETVLYFADPRWTRLVPEGRRLPPEPEAAARLRLLVEALADGPRAGGAPVLPRGTKLRGAYVGKGGLAVVDFEQGLKGFSPGGASGELLSVFGLVHTLVENVPGLREVQILVGGRALETLAGHVKIAEPLQPDPELLEQQPP